jgi:acetyltransferase-like isoleucine patch superfamily enzyme
VSNLANDGATTQSIQAGLSCNTLTVAGPQRKETWMSKAKRRPSEDPLSWLSRIATKLNSAWLAKTYPFAAIGKGLSAHYSCELKRSVADRIRVGIGVQIGRDAWINIPDDIEGDDPVLLLGDGCIIGRRCVISAKNKIEIGRNVVFAPQVLVMDHNHAFEDVNVPIIEQGTTEGGTIHIEDGCWIGFGASLVCGGTGELIIGKHSVVGANSVVSRCIPPYSVVSGNPARVVKQFDQKQGKWILGSVSSSIVEKK